jgi:hypothetical protein
METRHVVQDKHTPNAASHPTMYERNFEYEFGANSETQSVLAAVSLTVFREAGRYLSSFG